MNMHLAQLGLLFRYTSKLLNLSARLEIVQNISYCNSYLAYLGVVVFFLPPSTPFAVLATAFMCILIFLSVRYAAYDHVEYCQ